MLRTFHISATEHLPDGGLKDCELVIKLDESDWILKHAKVAQESNEYGRPQPSECEGG